jgi:eukaryotic-like serine/threonine-protein kinase
VSTDHGFGGPDTLRDPATEDTAAAEIDVRAIDDTVVASAPELRPSTPLVGASPQVASEPARGDSIGRFLVLGVLGTGGMGVVYSAYDPHLDRKVAIKLLGAASVKQGDATVRLLREAQAMAKINHPNVIKVHEVGTHGDQVFVAMEFADAGTLRAWLKQPRSRQEIVEVFSAAGRGLGAAHAVGLVHRDFKPDNVLMATDGSIRVTDFGLVSVSGAPPPRAVTAPVLGTEALTNDTPLSQDLTCTGAILGTPTYMAPEQFGGREATAQTDQFAFCVALYEALYGTRPFAGETYLALSSQVLLGEILPAPKGSQVPGWLRQVLLRGLSSDPERRYPSMAALLANLARDPARRWRRLAAGGAVIGLVGAGIAAISLQGSDREECRGGEDRFAAVWNATQRAQLEAALVATERPHAPATFAQLTRIVEDWGRSWQLAYTDACEDTRVRGEQSDRMLDLRMLCLTRQLDEAKATLDLLAAGGPDVADRALAAAQSLPSPAPCSDVAALTAAVPPPSNDATRGEVEGVRKLLDDARAKRRLARYAAGLEVARAALATARSTSYAPVIGEALLVTGMLENDTADMASRTTLREAMHVAAAAGDSSTMIDAAAWLTFALTYDAGHYAAAGEIASLADALATHAPPSPEIRVRLGTTIALLTAKRGTFDEAQARYERTLALAEQELGPDHPGTMTTLNQLGNLAKQQGRFEDARRYLERVITSRERALGKDHPEVAAALNNLGNVYRVQGELEQAKQVYERSLAIRIASLGPDHPEVGTSYNNLGTFYSEAGDNDEAEAHTRKALAIWEQAYGKDHVEVAGVVMNLGIALNDKGDRAGARAQFERARTLFEAAKGPDHPDVAGVLGNLGVVALGDGKLDDALQLFLRAEQIATKAYGADHPDVADYLANLTTVYKRQGKLREAKEMTQRALAAMAKAYGPEHPRMGGALINYGVLQIELDDRRGALETFQRALAIFEGKLGPDHPYVAFALNGIGGTLIELKQHAEAVPHLERSLAIRIATKQPPRDRAEVRYNLAQALIASPRTRKRARDEARTALGEYEQAGDIEKVKEIKAWLR